MKLTKEQKELLKKCADDQDWEAYHAAYDEILEGRVKEFDPEFLKSINAHARKANAHFWYA